MGSPESELGRVSMERRRTVHISRAFWLADRTICRGEYEHVLKRVGKNAFLEDIDEVSPTPDHPIVSQTWDEAVALCGILSTAAPESIHISLPTEAQWEFACRGGTTTAYSFGNDPSCLAMYAWYLANSPDRKTRPSRMLWPNPFGLFDMHGGVYEWCNDYYGPYEGTYAADPSGPATGPGRVLRGGGYNYSAQDCRSAYRYFTKESNRNARIGIRLCCDYTPS